MTAAVIDTNVMAAGLLTRQATSPVAHILDAMLDAWIVFVLSEVLLAEHRQVLLRPKLVALHGLSGRQIDAILAELAQSAVVPDPVPAGPASDPGDQHLWELLATRNDLTLVTGDLRLRQSGDFPQRIVSPDTFCQGSLPLNT